jgi:hypothetical protein
MKTATPSRSPENDNTLGQIRTRLDAWRKSTTPRSRIPGAIWDAAVVAAASYGINKTARTLRLDYYNLKKRLAASTTDPAPAFIELLSSTAGGGPEYAIELEACDGSKMRIQVKGTGTSDVIALSRELWRTRR